MLVYLRKLYSEKLIDQEMFTNGTNNAGALATTDSLGIVLHTTAAMISNEKIGDYVGLKSALIGPDGTGYVVDARSNLHSVGNYCVTTACENIEVAVAWVDYFYSEEGARFMLVGQEGKDWEIKADGKGYWTDETAARRTPDMSQDAFIALFSMWPGGRVPAAFYSDMWGGEYSDEPAATAKSMINHIIPTVWPIFSWTEEENEVVSTIESDIKSFIDNFFAQAVAGEVELTDDVWNDFVANVNSMGADELLGAYQTAVERIYAGGAY
jgi:putative aldouronate transport system substrate-binding protein